jgi:NAD(P)-dependent dehydrogenase (short-subunit alcohol dehydrogenase family)
MGRLTGKVALVTGGGRGIGSGIALELAREGADLAINYRRDRDAAEATAARVSELGRQAYVVCADVGDYEAVVSMFARVAGHYGRLDVVVANSGVASRFSPVADLEPTEWRRVMSTDLDGAFYTARCAVPHLVESRGSMIFISSVGADMAAAGGAPYHCAKAGVNTLTKVLAKELAPAGVRVNAIAPGLVRSDMGNRLLKFFGDELVRTIPLGRPGEPADIGRAAVFLASDDAGWITGKILRVDGGAHM